MPLTRLKDEYLEQDGVRFLMMVPPNTASRTSMATGARTLEPFGGAPRLDASARGRVGIARQPDEPGQRLREADDVLPGTGSNFERDALLRQDPIKHLSDWPTIARS